MKEGMAGFIGGGNMAEALIKGMTTRGMKDIIVSEPKEERRKYFEQVYGIRTTYSNKEAASLCNIVILAVKPQNMAAVLDEISAVVTGEKTVVSIAAGITLSYLQSKLRTKKLIRIMPNTPAIIQKGMSVISLWESFDDKDSSMVREIFMSVGNVLALPEKYMNAVTALSGSGPAFIAFFVETLIDGGTKMGLSRNDASELAIQTMIGTAGLLGTGMSPERLREMVTSPGGTTEEGLNVLYEKDLQGIVADSLMAAMKRAEELGRRE